MTFKEFKQVVNDSAADDNARVYIEQLIGENTYLQTEAVSVRREIDDIFSYFIIMGNMGD